MSNVEKISINQIVFEVTKISTGEKRRFNFEDLFACELDDDDLSLKCFSKTTEALVQYDGVWINFNDHEDDWKLSNNCNHNYYYKGSINPDLKIEVLKL